MQVHPEKVGVVNGRERFMLLDAKTKRPVSKKDYLEKQIRAYFKKHGASDDVIELAFVNARKRFDKQTGNAGLFHDLVEDNVLDSHIQ